MQHNAGFTRDDVATATPEIGVDRFTMGKVAHRLGVSAADLGHTVSSHGDLLVACLGRVSTDVTLPLTSLSWQDHLHRLPDSLWGVLDAHPGLDHTLINLAWAYMSFMFVTKHAHNALVSGGLYNEDTYLMLDYTLSTALTAHQRVIVMARVVESDRQSGRSERGIDVVTRTWDKHLDGSDAALGMCEFHELRSGDDADRAPFCPKESWLDRGATAPKLEIVAGDFSGLGDVLSGTRGPGASRGPSPAPQSNDIRKPFVSTLVLVFHPSISGSRVDKVLEATAGSPGGDITVHYIYDLYPGSNIDVTTEQAALLSADRVVLQYPAYWLFYSPLLKKWLDDVLTFGRAYGSAGTTLHGEELFLAVGIGGTGSAYGRESAHTYTIHKFLQPMQGISRVIGTEYAMPSLSVGALGITDEAIAHQAQDYAAVLQTSELPLLNTLGRGFPAILSYWTPVDVMTGRNPAYPWGAP